MTIRRFGFRTIRRISGQRRIEKANRDFSGVSIDLDTELCVDGDRVGGSLAVAPSARNDRTSERSLAHFKEVAI
jgi:hypothetical protein